MLHGDHKYTYKLNIQISEITSDDVVEFLATFEHVSRCLQRFTINGLVYNVIRTN